MSRMSDLAIDIEELLMVGKDAKYIANKLKIPVEWVVSLENSLKNNEHNIEVNIDG